MYDQRQLEGFASAQRLAYAVAQQVAASLRPGDSEKLACRRLGEALAARGVRQQFHQPFAWFGERTRLARFGRRQWEFFPTGQTLREGDIAILDIAPVQHGYAADIGFTFCCGEPSASLTAALAVLGEVRDMIPPLVTARRSLRDIYLAVEQHFGARGYDNCHREYPLRVLAHRLERLPERRFDPIVLAFGLQATRWLLPLVAKARLPGFAAQTPLWNDDPRFDSPPQPGIWAVEPHLGAADFGAKFEEMLVVTETAAYWLDDALPHVQRRAAA